MIDLDKMIENMQKFNARYQQLDFEHKGYNITIMISKKVENEEIEDT